MDTAGAGHPARRHQQRRWLEVVQPVQCRQHRQRDWSGLVAGAECVGDEPLINRSRTWLGRDETRET